MPDKTIKCMDCGNDFTFSEAEQQFFATKVDRRTGQSWPDPKRCKPCREENKRNRPKQDQQRG